MRSTMMELQGAPRPRFTAENVGVASWRIRTRRLPVRPRPIPSESAFSYLVRVTQANGFESPRTCWRAIQHLRPNALDSLQRSLGLLRAELYGIQAPFPNYTSITVPLPFGLCAEDFNHLRMRWCPLCLAESEHLRADWSIKLC